MPLFYPTKSRRGAISKIDLSLEWWGTYLVGKFGKTKWDAELSLDPVSACKFPQKVTQKGILEKMTLINYMNTYKLHEYTTVDARTK